MHLIGRSILALVATAAASTVAVASETAVTSPRIALSNLDSQIDALRRRTGGCDVAAALGLAERLSFRALLTSRWRDSLEALAVVERAATCAPRDAQVDIGRAAILAQLHRFDDAERALGAARAKGATAEAVRGVEGSLLHGRGDYEKALVLRRRDVEVFPNIRSLCALAILLGDMGRLDEAQALFDRARGEYRDVSPMPPAWLEYSRGRMLRSADRTREAAAAFERAQQILPSFPPNLGQLAEAQFDLGNTAFAIGILRRLAMESEDPDYAAHLSRMLTAGGQREEADRWRQAAASGFDLLMETAPEMFADHAAEFWMAAGADPRRALHAASINLTARHTPRATELFDEALQLVGDAPAPCRAALGARSALASCTAQLAAHPAAVALGEGSVELVR